jgi:predicted amidohydrolase YtcJ
VVAGIRILSVCLVLVALSGCGDRPDSNPFADAIFHGGPILTMRGDSPEYVEAVAIRDGKILYVGSLDGALAQAGSNSSVRDLKGSTLLPGFIDGHGHAFFVGFQSLVGNILPPPDGPVANIPSLVAEMKSWADENADTIDMLGWIVGMGYDDTMLEEKRHPTASELNQISSDIPVFLIHISGHLAAMNHRGLEVAGFSADTPDPAGGVIRREADGRTPDGVLEETPMAGTLFAILDALDRQANDNIALAGMRTYASYGFTTAQEGGATRAHFEAWSRVADRGLLNIDVAIYPVIQYEQALMEAVGTSQNYDNGVRIAGVKLTLDGSPQGKTAWLSQPYKVPPAGQPDDYSGYPTIPDPAIVDEYFDLALKNNWQILVHANGDAASEEMIRAFEKSAGVHGNEDRRPVMIHAQTVREDQLDRMRDLGIMPSFFPLHTFYWGDWHRDETLGKKRAYRISPAQSALRRDMRFTTHHDAPVVAPNSTMVLFTAVNRVSRSGDIIGEDQRISPYFALKSITDWGAYQYFEEQTKGTIEVGKLADLVILDTNPIEVDPASIKDIQVLETIKAGRSIFVVK